jgi:uncharacterized protein YjiS (DUF1127 family)
MWQIWTSHSPSTLHSETTSTIGNLVSLLSVWRWRMRIRRELSILTSQQIWDTGLDPELVKRESEKPFWKA